MTRPSDASKGTHNQQLCPCRCKPILRKMKYHAPGGTNDLTRCQPRRDKSMKSRTPNPKPARPSNMGPSPSIRRRQAPGPACNRMCTPFPENTAQKTNFPTESAGPRKRKKKAEPYHHILFLSTWQKRMCQSKLRRLIKSMSNSGHVPVGGRPSSGCDARRGWSRRPPTLKPLLDKPTSTFSSVLSAHARL